MIRRFRARRAQARDIALLDPDHAAQLCRTLTRTGVADRRTLILLAKRGQDSDLPGNAAAMGKYEALLRAGRRVKYKTYPVRFNFVHVPTEMVQEIEEALNKEKDS